MHYLRNMIVLLILYLAITGNLQFSNMVLGGIVATLAIVLLRPQPGRFTLRRLPVALLASIRYLVILIADIISSGIAVARVVLNPALPIRPGIIAIPSGCESELATALSAHALSVTPGELVIGIDEQGVLYTHCLDATHAADYIAQAQAMRRNLLSKIIA